VNEITDHLGAIAPHLDQTFRLAVDTARAGVKPRDDYATMATVRARHGFAQLAAPLLTAPDGNHKLAGSKVPAYGLTLQHFRVVLPAVTETVTPTVAPTVAVRPDSRHVDWAATLSDPDFANMDVPIGTIMRRHPRLSVNLCPNAGHCTRVCVLDNGMGRYNSVQRGRMWRTDLLARHPDAFVRILAWELVRAVRKHGQILFRPNVNSDVAWQTVLPSLTDGYIGGVMSYGYSKRPETLAGDGWLGSHYRVAYSWNERSNADAVRAFYMRGGAVAVVTARRKGAPVLSVFPFGTTADAVDADTTDEWMLTTGSVVGDLSAKGKARQLIGTSRFVVLAA
jgi:hypothetical protein